MAHRANYQLNVILRDQTYNYQMYYGADLGGGQLVSVSAVPYLLR